MLLYKYLHSDRIDVLQNSSIRFTQAEALNDPFESMPNFAKYRMETEEVLREKYRQHYGEEMPPAELSKILEDFNKEIENGQKNFGQVMAVLSLSGKRNNGLMWAHYADSYKGFVVGFDEYDAFFKAETHKSALGLKKVKYSQKREDSFPDKAPFEDIRKMNKTEMRKELEKVFFTKSIYWAYEDEYRIYARPKYADTIIDLGGENVYLFKFHPRCVKEIILGPRITQDNRDLLLAIAAQQYPKAKVFQASISEVKFDLDIAPVP